MERETFELNEIYFNPDLPENFNFTAHEERTEEMNFWWDKPYILIKEFSAESWIEHYNRLKNDFSWSDEQIGIKEEWEANLKSSRESWLKNNPSGFRYEVRCLDGGAWDRSTHHGFFSDVDEALKVATGLKNENT